MQLPFVLLTVNLNQFFYMINLSLYSFEILEDFFKVMPKLKVLNLCNMQRLSLPPSLDFLTNLQTLCLDYSNFCCCSSKNKKPRGVFCGWETVAEQEKKI